jgi:non-ribosomal peptide synthetase component E (peptide arylation enzyme)
MPSETVDSDSIETPADYVDRRAQSDPESIALLSEDERLTWRTVKRESDRLAAGLASRSEDATVFEQLPNGIPLYLLRLASEKAGIRLLTVPRTFRENELGPLFERLTPAVAVVPGVYRGFDYVDAVRSVGGESLQTVVALDGSGDTTLDAVASSAGESPRAAVRLGPSEVSQLATTSGSSGTPTCVEAPIGSRVRTGLAQVERYGVGSQDRIGVTTPLISGTPDAMAYHAGGAAGVSVDLLDRFEPARLAERIKAGISVLLAVPTVTVKLLEYIDSEGVDLSLSLIVNYGDKLAPSVGLRAEETFGCEVHQAFGTADYGGIAATMRTDASEQRLRTVGRPLSGNDVVLVTDEGWIRDEAGITGELIVDGNHRVGRPLVGEIEEVSGYFRVGVKAQFDDEGRVVLLDRTKDVVIRGGRNVYPTEVENGLTGLPEISQAAVVGIDDDVLGSRLVAFVVPSEPSADLSSDSIIERLRDDRNFASFKLPEHLWIVDELPMVPAGHKVDKSRLQDHALANLRET